MGTTTTAATAATALAAGLLTALAAPTHAGTDRDCGDFPSQRAAQLFFLANDPAADPHRLDEDGDRIACESNPAPYYHQPTPPSGPSPTPTPTPAPVPPPSARPLTVVKVVDGKLVRVREAGQRPYLVHLLGVEVPGSRCEARAAKLSLRDRIEPGRVVKVDPDRAAPERDRRGRRLLDLTTVRGGWDIGGSQIAKGYAEVDTSVRFSERRRYRRWERKAERRALGYHEECPGD